MKGLAMLPCMIFAAMLLALPSASVFAQYGSPPGRFAVQPDGQRGEPPARPSRDRQEAQRRQGDRGHTMTPDERQELNRDLQRANREIYRKGRGGR